jgi:methyl-accepting chemotaxis protein
MRRRFTFNQKVAAGLGASVLLTVIVAAVSSFALNSAVTSKDHVIDRDAVYLVDTERLVASVDGKLAASRAYLLTGEQHHLDQMRTERTTFLNTVDTLMSRISGADAREPLTRVKEAERVHQDALDEMISLRAGGADLLALAKQFDTRMTPKREVLMSDIATFSGVMTHRLDAAKRASTDDAAAAVLLVLGLGVVAILIAIAVAVMLTRSLANQIGRAVGQVQTSSAELEAVAGQQATGAKEEATAMSEITTTINELLATSRQIAESAKRVAVVAAETAGAARTGDGTIEQANDAITAIRRQVDLIVRHMLELGEKSQQIGAVLDIVSELAEQTNILAINATIEATSAGESGRRFAVVADEIRKLADRVGGSTKEIRGLIDDVRGAVNTTVMATETGSKAVDAGFAQFGRVAESFAQIADLVGTTTQAAREIELSTKQQTTAVEQVNVAVVDVAQATRATEASSTQTQQTAAQLAGLSRDLMLLVQSGAGR